MSRSYVCRWGRDRMSHSDVCRRTGGETPESNFQKCITELEAGHNVTF